MNNEQCTIFAQTERSSQMHLDDAEVQPKITQKRSGCVMNNVQFTMNNEQWEKVKLGEVGKISMCKRVFSFETSTEGEIPFYKIGTFGKDADAFISRQLYEEYKSKFSYPKVGDILISASGTIGRTVVYDGEPAYFQDSNIIWIDNDETIVLNQFLYYQYQIISWNLEGSTIARLYNDNFNKIEITIPDLPAQRRIAAILASADKVIAATQKTIAKYKQIKQGMMEDLLNEQCTMNNVQWKKVKLGECCDKITDGCHIKPKCVAKSQFLMLSSQNIKDNKLDLSDVSYLTFDDFERENHRTNIKAGDVLLTIVGTVGRTYLVKENDVNFTLQRSVAVLAPKATLDSSFLLYTLNNLQFVLENEAHGCAQKGIYLKQLNQLLISIPDLAAQRRIAAILSGIDAKIAAEEKVLQKYEKVKKGLMERLLEEDNDE